ncbi:MAG: hypothetical protein IKU27_05020 [Clostridia bacterium]|nr:hypothetical protein [Clostridia bacterium]
MKRFITLLWTVAILGSLTLVAQADAIAGPSFAMVGVVLTPVFLVVAVIMLTWTVLKSFRKK